MTNTNKIITGGSGAGKSHFIKHHLIPQARKRGLTVAILDVEDEYSDVADCRVDNPSQISKACEQGHDVIRWVPSYVDEQTEQAGRVCDRFIVQTSVIPGDTVALIEEAHNFQKSQKIYSKKLKKANKQGQKYGLSVWQVSQEPQDFERSSWNNSGDIFVFTLKQDVGKLNDRINYSELEISSPQEIPIHHFIYQPNDVSREARLCSPI